MQAMTREGLASRGRAWGRASRGGVVEAEQDARRLRRVTWAVVQHDGRCTFTGTPVAFTSKRGLGNNKASKRVGWEDTKLECSGYLNCAPMAKTSKNSPSPLSR